MSSPNRRAPLLLIALAACTTTVAAACTEATTPHVESPPSRRAEPIAGLVLCPKGTEPDGNTCVRTEVLTVVKCPPGSHLEKGECLREILTDCPGGMTFRAGVGCVPVIAATPIDGPPNANVPPGLTGAPAGSKCPSGMAFVPGGSFTLGGYVPSAGSTVTVKSFCLDVNEVSVAEYRKCAKKGTCGSSKLSCNADSATWTAGDDRLPINCVDYNDSATYCASAGKRLANEDEWEWAARGGNLARKYPWGPNDDWTKVCASTPSKRKLPCPVGSFRGGDTLLGVHDMAGSVWEWTTSPRPGDNLSPTHHSIRGGGWDIVVGFPSFASSSRVGYEPSYRSKAVGFRCAKGV